jgi:toluene monooxygenase system protein A
MFEKMANSIQSDEARHAQIGSPVLRVVAEHDPEYAQGLCDKWFWRSFLLLAIVTGFAMDYLAPLQSRQLSFKEFMHEWVVDQYLAMLEEHGLEKPWYWDTFIASLDTYHHMVYASAYTYRASVWFDFVVPGPRERAWLRTKYPESFHLFDPVWERIGERWRAADANNDFAVHGTAIVTFCDLCQLVLAGGTPARNTATVLERDGKKYIFCSEPCRWIFEREVERYAAHRDVVKRVLAGEAPANLVALVRRYFGLAYETWGKDIYGGAYPWLVGRCSSRSDAQPPRAAAPLLAPEDGAPLVPLYGFLEGDTVGLLVLADLGETAASLADKLQQAASVRVSPRAAVRVVHGGRTLDPRTTLACAGIAALDRFDVVVAEER